MVSPSLSPMPSHLNGPYCKNDDGKTHNYGNQKPSIIYSIIIPGMMLCARMSGNWARKGGLSPECHIFHDAIM